MTKTQEKRAYQAIMSKAQKCWTGGPMGSPRQMSTADYIAIEKICKKYLKKF
tara:strand:+ start:370 stop:525 length:156 start_codon:yes stop_codon:yes gene_type:complete